jgi:proliferating cell nuclear antigen
MKIKLNEPLLLSKAIDLISELVTEVRLRVSEFGVSITATDPANVCMVNFKIPKSSFSIFESEDDALGVNLDNLKKILKRCGSGSALTLEKVDNQLEILIEDKIKRNFSLGLIEIEREEKEIPNLEYSASIEISSEDLISSIEDCSVVSDVCSFIVSEGKFIIESKEINSARTEFSGDEVKIDAEDCKSRYSLEYLGKFIKGAKLFEKININFATDHPLKVGMKTEHVEMKFILAPRVETED